MPEPALQCPVEPGGPLLTVRPAGVLRLDTVGRLRVAVLGALVDEPDAVAIDLAGVTAFDDHALTELHALVQAAAAWPGVPIVVHSAAPPLRARLEVLGLTPSVAVVADAAAALMAVSGGPRPARVHLELTDGLGQLAQVRAMVRQACAGAGWGHAAGAAQLVATELAANALRHGTGPRAVSVAASPHHLHVAVRDRSAGRPSVRDGHEAGGRGLRIVERLSTAWGTTPTADGKVVWATVRSQPPARR